MNTGYRPGPALRKALAAKLGELLRSFPGLKGWTMDRIASPQDGGFDFRVALPAARGRHVDILVQCKAEPRPSQFPYAGAPQWAPSAIPVFAAPHISSNLAEICQQHGWSWFDLAGNCHIEVPGLLFLERKGNEPVRRPPRPRANLSTPESARVVRALLVGEGSVKPWTQREMQNETQLPDQPSVSLGLVNKVVQYLRDEAFIESTPDGFRLRDPLKLLFAWRNAYRFDRHQQRRYFTLKKAAELREDLARLESDVRGEVAYCAFSAADFQAPHVRQPKTWLFVSAELEEKFASATEAKVVDSGENLMVLLPNDAGVFYLADAEAGRLACTNPVQTYVDLWHCGGRGREAAEALLEQKLKPEWKLRRPL
jgi:hypothetical protein